MTQEETGDEMTDRSIFDNKSQLRTLRKPSLKQKIRSPKVLPSLKGTLTAKSSLPVSTMPNSTIVLSTQDA